jgi:predicted exporter
MTSARPRLAVALWLVLLALSAWQLSRTRVIADLGAFLPPSATPTQQLLLEQMRSVASRIVLIAVGGAPESRLVAASRAIASELGASGLFTSVQNGAEEGLRADREALIAYRYVLSPAVTAERFGAPALRAALESGLAELAARPGSSLARLLPRDPTGELGQIIERLPGAGPQRRGGVWFSRDGKRALLVAETVAGGFDAVAQQEVIRAIEKASAGLNLELSGAGVFAAASRAAIEREAWLLSLVSGTLILLLMLRIFRRARIVGLCFVPVASGLALGAATVALAFGNLHAITLGFGATLIGEAVDYPSYACLNAAPGESLRHALERIWPTLRLAVLTTVLGGLTMLLSSFAGLAQLGLLTMSGVLAAGLVTRHVVPALAGGEPVMTQTYTVPAAVDDVLTRARRFSALVWVLAAAAAAVLYLHRGQLWEDDLQAMNPVPERLKATDRELRREIGAPDVRYLALARAQSREAALQHAEALEPKLEELVGRGALHGYELATRYLPSAATQAQRLEALPDPSTLQGNLREALRGLPFRPGVFEPFLREVEENRQRGPLTAASLRGTALGMKVDTLVTPVGLDWVVLVPLYGVTDARALGAEITLLDLKGESERLLAGYRLEALRLGALAMAAIVLALMLGLRRLRAVLQVAAPVAAALLVSVALLHLAGERLTVFHLIAMLLVMGIGLNYSLFFDRPEEHLAARQRTLFALFVTCATTLLAFGTLAFSTNPVLRSIGLTVTVGTLTAFAMSAMMARR